MRLAFASRAVVPSSNVSSCAFRPISEAFPVRVKTQQNRSKRTTGSRPSRPARERMLKRASRDVKCTKPNPSRSSPNSPELQADDLAPVRPGRSATYEWIRSVRADRGQIVTVFCDKRACRNRLEACPGIGPCCL